VVTHCLNSYTSLEGEEATFSSPGKHKATIEIVSGKLQVAEQQIFV
jgi:hypothetical protein